MPRIRVRKTRRGLFSQESCRQAAQEVIDGQLSVRRSAEKFGLCHVTLSRYVNRMKGSQGDVRGPGYRAHNRVFNEGQEEALKLYLLRAASIYFGLSPKEVRRFAYQLAVQYECQYPAAWTRTEMAGKDWFTSFLERHPTLSIRRPQATSLSRATSFNPKNVSDFFSNLASIYARHTLQANQVWNMDETGTTTVQVPDKIVAGRGQKQVGAMTSAERGTLVTLAMAVNALGNSTPPQFVFPRKKFQDHFIRDGPTGCVGTASGSGWMQEQDFLVFLRHFIHHSRASPEFPQLLLLDNHASHLSLEGIDLCRANGVILLSFPPHCSHKLQPLDRSVYGPLKHYINTTIDWWMKSNPGKTVCIYDIPGIVTSALPLAATPSNIMAGFRCTGIWPFNPAVFSEADFSPAFVTDRPAPPAPEPAAAPGGHGGASHVEVNTSPAWDYVSPGQGGHIIPSPSAYEELSEPGHSLLPREAFSPVAVRPFPKAGPRKTQATQRKRRATAILTDTPVKRALEEEKKGKVKLQRRKGLFKPGTSTVGAVSVELEESKRKMAELQKQHENSQRDLDEAPPALEEAMKGGRTIPKKQRASDLEKQKMRNSQKKKGNKKAEKKEKNTSHQNDGSTECLVCEEDFASSRPGEVWVQCLFCGGWAHEACTEGARFYICHHCDMEEMK